MGQEDIMKVLIIGDKPSALNFSPNVEVADKISMDIYEKIRNKIETKCIGLCLVVRLNHHYLSLLDKEERWWDDENESGMISYAIHAIEFLKVNFTELELTLMYKGDDL